MARESYPAGMAAGLSGASGRGDLSLRPPAPPPLAVERLALTGFRNYAEAKLAPGAGPVLLLGPNGAGKTNLLEALSLLAPGRGLRRAKLSEIARRGAASDLGDPAAWAFHARISGPAGAFTVGSGLKLEPAGEGQRERRQLLIDDEPQTGQRALAERLAVLWLTPAMDGLLREGASERRRFLDRFVEALDPGHGDALGRYEQALRERARLLREGRQDATWLAALETRMAESGVALAAGRRRAVRRLATAALALPGPFPQAALALDGEVEAWLDEMPALAAEDRFRVALAERRQEDAEAVRRGLGSGLGPHKSDLLVSWAGRDLAAAEASTGEQKALLLSLVLAEAEVLTAERGQTPLLLLDEVAAHLDAERRRALFDLISGLGLQAWMSGTEAAQFEALAGWATGYAVDAGRLAPHPAFKDRQ